MVVIRHPDGIVSVTLVLSDVYVNHHWVYERGLSAVVAICYGGVKYVGRTKLFSILPKNDLYKRDSIAGCDESDKRRNIVCLEKIGSYGS
jgi:hypothetical protein